MRLSAFTGAAQLLPAAGVPLFEEINPAASGIAWIHENAMSDRRHLPETLGPGCAFLDYDNDGWMDLLLVNSGPCDFYQPKQRLRHALYKNNRDGTFRDVTDAAGLTAELFAMGVVVADYDNDGFPDILITSYGKPVLYHNNGDGTFKDVTAAAKLDAPGWTTSGVWLDYDGDGRLDLFLCSFVQYGKESLTCGDNKLGRNYYCIPRVFKPTANFLFHNNGDGTFTEVSKGTDIQKALGKGLGVVTTDVNNDGRLDLFVANDTVQNFLFVNRGANKWEEAALSAEVGFSDNGQARSGMGVDSADVDGDGWEDLFVANVDQEMFSLYKNNKNETYSDVSHRYNVAQPTRLLSGWGLKFFDYDNDGRPDLILANGHPDDMIESYSQQVRYREPLLLFHNEDGKFRNVSAEAGPVFSKAFSARGLAVGDYNNDGKIDVLLANNGAAPALLKNVSGGDNHWIGLRLQGVKANRDAIGAKLTISVAGVRRSRLKTQGGSYLSSHDPREVFGLGKAAKLDYVEVKWPAPSGLVERFFDLPPDRYSPVTEGKGKRL
ncbi:MAG: CRTAC1 family protein [Bryobacteraceae bacterium]